MQLFERAKRIGLEHVRSWLPNGRAEGDEWVCYSLERDENTPSFKVNVTTGKWSDFGDSSIAGNDVVSLYAYLNKSDLEHQAREKNYKNFDGGVQAEAARTILEDHDPTYFPGSEDNFTPPKTKGGFWDGFRQDTRGIDSPPELDVSWYEKNWGDHEQSWTFYNSKNKLIMYAARFRDSNGKKNDRPFTLWTNGTEYKWRAKGLPAGEIPFWGLPELLARPNDPFILFEGQKDSSAAAAVIGDEYVCIGWYGGAGNLDKTDTSHLLGREGYFWTDADSTGRKVIKSLETLKLDLKLIRPPLRVKKGWGIADAIEDGWDKQRIIEHIEDKSKDEKEFIDSGFPFRIIGTTAERISFYTAETMQLMRYKKSSLNKGSLMTLMPRQEWGSFFQKPDGGTAWDAAVDWVLREAATAPVYNNSLVRGSGAWIDNNRVVINTGEKMLREGKQEDLFNFESKYTYERKAFVPYSVKNPMRHNESMKFFNIMKSLDWSRPEFAAILAGWIFLAPFSGALTWRPHCWLSGSKGSGKSWILDNIVFPVLGPFAIKALGSSTAPGIRQKLNNNILPVVIDEAESDNKAQYERVEEFLTMARQSSSGAEDGAAIFHGNTDGTGTEWRVQSMFMFASIGAVIKHGADKDRFSICLLKNPRRSKIADRKEKFTQLKKDIEILTPAWCSSFHSRTLSIIDEVVKAVDIFRNQVTDIIGTVRGGDQIGTLLAGAYMSCFDKAPLASECKAWLAQWDLTKDVEAESAEEECVSEILSAKIEITSKHTKEKYPIGSLLRYWFTAKGGLPKDLTDYQFDIDPDRVKLSLEAVGIKPVMRSGNHIQVAIRHRELRNILKDTAWKDNYISILERLDYCIAGVVTGGKFAGVSRISYIRLKADSILDDCPF